MFIKSILNKPYKHIIRGVDKMKISKRPINTLFMLMSLDGKINSGNSDELDVDRNWGKIDGVKEGLYQYYEIEKTTDWYSLNTGRVMAKIGVNERKEKPQKIVDL